MTSPGQICYRLRHGLIAAYYRDAVRPRILVAKPMGGMDDDACEVHLLTSGEDCLNAIWSIRSFYVYTQARFRLCIHTDSTVVDTQIRHLRRQFPGARIVSNEEGKRLAEDRLAGHQALLQFRRTNCLSAKVLDFFLSLSAEKLIVLDSDVLFFARPEAFLKCCEQSFSHASFNRDVATAYVLDGACIRDNFGIRLEERINSGLGVIPAGAFDPALIEKALRLVPPQPHFWRIEQTLMAILCSSCGHEPLPSEYDVYTDARPDHARPARHYVGAVRHLMYREGIRRLVRAGFLDRER